jgi:hypothetical protein
LRLNSHQGLTLAQQYLFLRANPVCRGQGVLGPTTLIWTYPHRPTALSREYDIQISYRKDETPDVFVLRPDIEMLAEGRSLPHVYRNPLRLCLYLPGSREWDSRKRIDQAIVPWTALWLFYFEEWLASDEWQGGGEHPSDAQSQGNRRTRRLRL